jgi:hypothetical protein
VGADIRPDGRIETKNEQGTLTMITNRSSSSTADDLALAAFVTRKAEIDAMLEQLAGFSDDHFGVAPDDVNWAHVGDLGYVIDRLRQASDFLFQEGECAG